MSRLVLTCLAVATLIAGLAATTAAQAGGRTYSVITFSKHVDKSTP